MFACLLAAPDDASTRPIAERAGLLLATAREFSPRIERAGDAAVVCDVAGLDRLFGDGRTIAREMRRDAASRGVMARVAIAPARTAAVLLAHARPGLTVVARDEQTSALAPLPVALLEALGDHASAAPRPAGAGSARFYRTSPMADIARRARASPAGPPAIADILATLGRWGIKTLGAFAALPAADVSARLGAAGLQLQRRARGEDLAPLVPLADDERFEQHLALEWPIEGLEPLSFVLGRLFDPLCAHLDRRGRAAVALITTLRLVTRETVVRTVALPAPMRDPRVLRTLALLDLESHPPSAGIDAVTVSATPTPGRILQFSLLERALPAPEHLSTLLARLTALMGADRCGAAALVDSHRPGAFRMEPFAVEWQGREVSDPAGATRLPAAPPALRRHRHPVPLRVTVDRGQPVRVAGDRPGTVQGRVDACAGPWRTSGSWWQAAEHAHGTWDRDEWDVALEDGTLCRIFEDRGGRGWFLDAVID